MKIYIEKRGKIKSKNINNCPDLVEKQKAIHIMLVIIMNKINLGAAFKTSALEEVAFILRYEHMKSVERGKT